MTTELPHDLAPSTAQLTVGRISAGMESQLMPMIGQILRIIRDISGKSEHMSVGDLVEFISGEPTMMGRIVTIASSVGYNSSGIEINSIHHAISLIGFDRVRTLAVSILLLESAHSDYTSAVNRELAGSSLIAGLVAAEMSRHCNAADSELAFLCGALRNYGRMLAATFLAEEYALAIKPAPYVSLEESFQSVFGLTTLELGRQLMDNMLLPKVILNTFVPLSLQDRRHCSASASTALIGMADFGQRFAELLPGKELDQHNFERRIESLSREYDVSFYLSRNEIRDVIHHLVGVLECFRYRAGSYVGSVNMFRRLETLAAERVLPVTLDVALPPVAPSLRPSQPVAEPADSFEI